RALRNTFLNLPVDLVTSLLALHGAELCALFRPIAHLKTAHRIDQCRLKTFKDRADYNEPLAGDAALAAIHHSRSRSALCSSRNIRVFQHDVGIGSAKLEHAFLENRPRGRRDTAAGRYAARQGHGGYVFIPYSVFRARA